MLQRLLEVLQHSSLFQSQLQQQLHRETPDLDVVCRCCCQSIEQTPDSRPVMEQLVDNSVQGVHADHPEAEKHKQAGTACFRRSDYLQAAESYTEALMHLDRTSVSGAAAACGIFCNRALTCLRQTPPDPEAAVFDSSCAIQCDEANSKAWYRRACSHEALQNYAAACSDAAVAVEMSSGAQLEDCIKLLQHLQAAQQQSASSDTADRPRLLSSSTISTESKKPFRMPPGWSSEAATAQPPETVLAVQTSAEGGRQLVVVQDVTAGSVLWSEEPYVHLLLKQHSEQRCSCCLKPVKAHASYSCPACPLVRYCTPDCCQKDHFHTPGGAECGLPWSLLLPPHVVLATRMAAHISQQGPGDCARHVRSLQTHLKQTSLLELTELLLLSTLAAHCCSHQRAVPQPTAGNILTALLQIHINGLAVVPQQHTDARDRIALALYPVASLMNHSCQPNIALSFDGTKLTARAVEPIGAGQAVLHCYGPQKGALITAVRQQQLKEQYHFVCRCRACQAGLDACEEGMVGLRCLDRSCAGVVVPKQAVAAGLCSTSALPSGIGNGCCSRCRTCWSSKLEDNSHPVWVALIAAKSEYGSALSLLQGVKDVDVGSLAGARQRLMHVLEIQQQQLSKANQLTAQTSNQLAEVFAALGDAQQAAGHCQKVLESLLSSYSSNSTAVAYQRLKLAQLQGLLGQHSAAQTQTANALRTLQLHSGDAVA